MEPLLPVFYHLVKYSHVTQQSSWSAADCWVCVILFQTFVFRFLEVYSRCSSEIKVSLQIESPVCYIYQKWTDRHRVVLTKIVLPSTFSYTMSMRGGSEEAGPRHWEWLCHRLGPGCLSDLLCCLKVGVWSLNRAELTRMGAGLLWWEVGFVRWALGCHWLSWEAPGWELQ